ncbi:hypothetical protein [Mycobacterium persicum]|uniref:Uncharacterized protein n=1 Tax=Mycobacterium persicum TaxID=1487726 RepID=A0A1X0L5A0_9MYCO|nr:hypothetical protein [Mycobacterium persicum]KZS85815.1 hypothetical protein A4G31_03690 [Mycobacterium persicum]ORB46628.1 hypothetical protein BST40_18135 [Mycobacterium persicum]ORB88570.1 hypothetical protein B1T49_03985 [Mycobacterium persicum]ORB93881.1 hypothetical protein B1T44_04310 [Mycobacterium persicum]ORC00615.1 hypothetical protein B1T48_03920 [Mycobacterium persicum]
MSINHRRVAAYPPGELVTYVRAGWELDQEIRTYVEVVHRLNDLGAVVTHAAHGISREGFDAEWRGVDILAVDADLPSHCELFDEADLQIAIARFEQLGSPASRLETWHAECTSATGSTSPRDWAAIAEPPTAETSLADHRRLLNSGVRRGRDAEIDNLRALAEIGVEKVMATIIVTRGARVALCRTCAVAQGQQRGGL